MSYDVYCAQCGEPWSAWGVKNGDMTDEEAKIFLSCQGCPSCLRNGSKTPVCWKCSGAGVISVNTNEKSTWFRACDYDLQNLEYICDQLDPDIFPMLAKYEKYEGDTWFHYICPRCMGSGLPQSYSDRKSNKLTPGMATGALIDILGDDLDGVASELYDYFG